MKSGIDGAGIYTECCALQKVKLKFVNSQKNAHIKIWYSCTSF